MLLAFFLLSLICLLFGPIGWLLSGIFFILFILTLIFKGIASTSKAINKSITEKKCPYCQSTISSKAVKCPHCQSDLIQEEKVITTNEPEPKNLIHTEISLATKIRNSELLHKILKKIKKISKFIFVKLKQLIKICLSNKKYIYISVISIVIVAIIVFSYSYFSPQTIYYADGKTVEYEGMIKDENYHGKGTLYDEKGNIVYQGEWQVGKRNGKGLSYFENGQLSYEGEWKNNKRSGFGKQYNKDGNLIYEGEYRDGVYSGEGKQYQNNKLVYKGTWLNGEKSGTGYLYDDEDEIFSGEFKYDKPYNGYGIIFDEDAQLQFEGELVDGLYNGEGKLYENNQLLFSGTFKRGEYENGKYTKYENDQLIEEGDYGNGAPVNSWKLYYKSGELKKETIYQDGVIQSTAHFYESGDEKQFNTFGNTNINITNNAIATKEDKYIYYLQNGSNPSIMREHIDTGERTRITEVGINTNHINVIQETLYYIDKDEVVRYDIETNEKEILHEGPIRKLVATDEYLFIGDLYGPIYRSDLLGEDLMEIYSDLNESNFVIDESYVYIAKKNPRENTVIIRMDYDGSNVKQIISSSENMIGYNPLTMYKDKLYLRFYNNEILEVSKDGKSVRTHENMVRSNWTFYENKLITSDPWNELTLSDINLENAKVITGTESLDHLTIIEDYVYFKNYNDNDSVYRVKIDGTSKEKLQ